MSTELSMLLWSSLLCVVLALPYALGAISKLGVPRLAGNRDDVPLLEGWIGRGRKTHTNGVRTSRPSRRSCASSK